MAICLQHLISEYDQQQHSNIRVCQYMIPGGNELLDNKFSVIILLNNVVNLPLNL